MSIVESSLFGIRICSSTPEDAANAIHARAQTARGIVCVANVDMVTRAVSDHRLAQIMSSAFAVVTDGMPLVWALRARDLRASKRVYGPQLTRDLCEIAAQAGTPIFFFGGSQVELDLLQKQLLFSYPGLRVVGALSPPLLPASPPLDMTIVENIRASGARIVFVGLGCPKQEYWMQLHGPEINAVLVGVGLAFAQIAGLKRKAPQWLQAIGMEWLFRLLQEPRRLFRRYLVGNSRFIWYSLTEFLGKRIR